MDIVRLVVQFGVHEEADGEAVAPGGRPDREKETGSIVPDMVNNSVFLFHIL